MKPKWQKLASLAQEICTLWFQFFGAVFASKGYPFKNILSKQRAGTQIGTAFPLVLIWIQTVWQSDSVPERSSGKN